MKLKHSIFGIVLLLALFLSNIYSAYDPTSGTGGGNVFTASNNTFSATNYFTSVRIGTNSTYASAIPLVVFTTNETVAVFGAQNATDVAQIQVGNNTTTGTLYAASSVVAIQMEKASCNFQVRANSGTALFQVASPSGLMTALFNAQVNGNWTQGDASSDTATWNNATTAIPNGQNIGSGALFLSNAWGGGINVSALDGNRFRVNTPTTVISTADTLLSASVSNRIGLYVQGQLGQSSNIVAFGDSTGTDLFQYTAAGRFINVSGGNSVSSPTAGSAFGGTAINGINVKVISSTVSTNMVFDTAPGQTTPFLIIESTNGTSLVQIQENSIRFGTNGTAFSSSIAQSFTLDPPSIAAQSTFYTNVVIAGLANGSVTMLGTDVVTSNIVYNAYATAANQATIALTNPTGSAVDPANQTVRVRSIQP